MKAPWRISYCIVLSLAGCPGTLDDPESFEGAFSETTSVRDAGLRNGREGELVPSATPRDAGTRDADGWDAWTASGSAITRSTDTVAPDASVADAAVRGGSDTLSSWTDAGSAGNSAASASNDVQGAVADARSAGSEAGGVAKDAGGAAKDAGSSCDFQGLIANKCGDCHGRVGASAGLDLASANLAARLSGKKGTLACGSYALIDTARPERSALYLKVTADACGSRMPLGVTLTDGEQMCILDWIAEL